MIGANHSPARLRPNRLRIGHAAGSKAYSHDTAQPRHIIRLTTNIAIWTALRARVSLPKAVSTSP